MKFLYFLLTIILILAAFALVFGAICLFAFLFQQYPLVGFLIVLIGADITAYLSSYVWGLGKQWFWIGLFLTAVIAIVFLPKLF